jgi:eukaryotic-like serine/threonine-protein kinase
MTAESPALITRNPASSLDRSNVGIELASGAIVAERYRLVRPLGEGGMGVVWAGARIDTEEGVALKFVKETSNDPELFRRLLREARAACAVHHPNVVQVHEVLELEDGRPALVMEVLEGESLGERLSREGELDVAETARILLPVVSAVGAAHSLGIVHRDLKPENIFLARDHRGELVKVLDFGIAKLTAVDGATLESAGLTRTGALLGTPYYMAPEQVFGETDIDHRADIWALGMILYRCLSGILPTERENLGQVLKVIVTRSIWPLADAAPNLPRPLTDLVDRMLSKDRDRRPRDLREVAAVLGDLAPTLQLIEFGAPNMPAPLPRLHESEPPRRGPSLAKRPSPAARFTWPLIAILGLGAAVTAWALFGGEHHESTEPAATGETEPASVATIEPAPAAETAKQSAPAESASLPPSEPEKRAPPPARPVARKTSAKPERREAPAADPLAKRSPGLAASSSVDEMLDRRQ